MITYVFVSLVSSGVERSTVVSLSDIEWSPVRIRYERGVSIYVN